MQWISCSQCGASFRNDENLTKCKRCNHELVHARSESPSVISSRKDADVKIGNSIRVPSMGAVFKYSAVLCIFGVGLFGALFYFICVDRRIPLDAKDWWIAAVAGGLAGLMLASIITLVVWQSSPRQDRAVVTSLTSEMIGPFLAQMGYEFETVRSSPGSDAVYDVFVTRYDWHFAINVCISPNRQNLWFSTTLCQFSDEAQAASLLGLLQANHDFAPAFFAHHRESNSLVIQRCIENQAITPAQFRLVIEDFMDTVQRTFPYWDVFRKKDDLSIQDQLRQDPLFKSDLIYRPKE